MYQQAGCVDSALNVKLLIVTSSIMGLVICHCIPQTIRLPVQNWHWNISSVYSARKRPMG